MDTEAIEALVEQLGDDVGTLEGALKPLLKSNTTEVASKLALLDRAKLYILITYAIEAILFCAFLYRWPIFTTSVTNDIQHI